MTKPVLSMKVEGLAELRVTLQQLPQELHKGPLRSAVSAAAKVVQDAARANAPVDTGVLKKSIYRTRSKSESSDVQEAAIVGIRFGKRYQRRGLDAWYWRLIEFGTQFVQARPFLRPAFDNTIQQQLDAMRVRLTKAIERAAAKWSKSKS